MRTWTGIARRIMVLWLSRNKPPHIQRLAGASARVDVDYEMNHEASTAISLDEHTNE